MNKKILWLLLFVPAIFIGASNPFANTNTVLNDNDTQPCSSYGEKHKNWNGNSGCGYVFDFNDFIVGECILSDIDLNPATPNVIDHFYESNKVRLYTSGADGKITMYVKPGYTGPGFINSCDINLHFTNNPFEYALWTMIIDNYAGPYPEPCY